MTPSEAIEHCLLMGNTITIEFDDEKALRNYKTALYNYIKRNEYSLKISVARNPDNPLIVTFSEASEVTAPLKYKVISIDGDT